MADINNLMNQLNQAQAAKKESPAEQAAKRARAFRNNLRDWFGGVNAVVSHTKFPAVNFSEHVAQLRDLAEAAVAGTGDPQLLLAELDRTLDLALNSVYANKRLNVGSDEYYTEAYDWLKLTADFIPGIEQKLRNLKLMDNKQLDLQHANNRILIDSCLESVLSAGAHREALKRLMWDMLVLDEQRKKMSNAEYEAAQKQVWDSYGVRAKRYISSAAGQIPFNPSQAVGGMILDLLLGFVEYLHTVAVPDYEATPAEKNTKNPYIEHAMKRYGGLNNNAGAKMK